MSQPPHWEKQGNAAWVACPRCVKWFPVDPQVLAQRRIDLVCPGCGHAFRASQDKEPA
jgi:uncharacterized C2H2 Zn-finger protein